MEINERTVQRKIRKAKAKQKKRHDELRIGARKEWFDANWISLFGLLVSFASLIISLIALQK